MNRREAVGGSLAAVAVAPATAPEITVVLAQDLAPPASDVETWIAYEARLRARLADAGRGRFDEAGARTALEVANRARTAAGAPPLTWHDELAQTARAHGGDQARRGKVDHLSPEGFDPSHRLWLIGRTTIGSPSENLAYHHAQGPAASPLSLVNQWRASREGHWQNLLRPSHTHAAFALLRGPDWALLLGLFCRPLATLAEPLPFLAHGEAVAEALRRIDPELRPRLGSPQGARRSSGPPGRRMTQLSGARRDAAGGTDYIGGPIFLPTR